MNNEKVNNVKHLKDELCVNSFCCWYVILNPFIRVKYFKFQNMFIYNKIVFEHETGVLL